MTITATVKSRTSGRPLPALIVGTSKLREFFGMRHVNAIVCGSSLKEKVTVRSNWYRNDEITIIRVP